MDEDYPGKRPQTVCLFEFWRCSSRKSRDLDALRPREVMVVMKVEILVMVVIGCDSGGW